ncbi:carboxypeptidase cpdS precursor [Cordyceps militaris CM01]|uniref:Carboxypeptidase cpdS n=1 Tax=Cordyceps militaris (strain CM01) TaxID=983644 RepID=G3JKN0_CORMM|nr:carboxypeptidase cpdS precursor [Cordyceps militaris CM01]EGX91469.1 carboxypeptidase cpdS precursor [Cordyceps militaris CM01]
MSGLLIYTGISWGEELQSSPVAFPYLDQHYGLMPIDHRPAHVREAPETQRIIPSPLPHAKVHPNGSYVDRGCAKIFDHIYIEALRTNPCFNVYNIVDRCPARNDPLPGKDSWFNRRECKQVFPDNVDDQSDPAGVHVLPQVIDQSENVIIAEGTSDYLLSLNGILLGVQNMTWGGQLGFQQAPSDPFDVPAYGFDPEQMFKDDYDPNFNGHELPAGYGVMVLPTMSALAGHEGPEYTPTASLRILEKLLGRIDSLTQVSAFTLPQISNITQPKGELGNGTVRIPC